MKKKKNKKHLKKLQNTKTFIRKQLQKILQI